MSSRPGVVVKKDVPADGGVSPNRYNPAVTAELRVFWPPLATDEEIERALELALFEARKRISHRRPAKPAVQEEVVEVRTVCGASGGQGIGAGHVCRCVAAVGHKPLYGMDHGCSCGALWKGVL